MGIIDLIFLPISVVFAIIGAMVSGKKADAFCIFSFVFCAIPPIGSVFDMNWRAAGGDIAGILDIYPVMGIIFVLFFAAVTLINVMRVMKGRCP
ncbi:MAG: hypothetical protein NC489_39980 [Ruminococcus flavefaciens]|nr:hypothetical protein [Ruminococcus flavefaciens]